MEQQPKTLWQKITSGSGWALFIVLVYEMVEESIESLIAWAISNAMTIFVLKALSTFVITQGVKISIKRFLTPIIKTLTYKEGHDKMSKIKTFFTWFYCNKKTLVGILSGAAMSLGGTGIIEVSKLPNLEVSGFNITPILFYGCLAILTLVGILGKGFENIKTFFERVGVIKAQKEEKAIMKEAKKELATEEKIANQTQAQQEQAKAKAEAEQIAKAKAEKEEQEHKARVEAAKAKIHAKTKFKKELDTKDIPQEIK